MPLSSPPCSDPAGTRTLTLLSREECELCEQMLVELQAFCAALPAQLMPTVEVRDVDADPELRRRFGHHIPVLLLEGEPICRVHFDPVEVKRLLQFR